MIEKSEKIELVQIKELPAKMNREVDLTPELLKDSQIGYFLIFQYQENKDVIALHLMISYATKSKIILLENGATFIAKLGTVVENEESIKQNEQIEKLVEYAFAFVSGMIYKNTVGTIFNTVFIPYIEAKNSMQNMQIQKLR